MKKFLSLLIILAFFSCSKDSDSSSSTPQPQPPEADKPIVVTLAPEFVVNGLVFHGEVTHLGDGYTERGFCWSWNLNPIVSTNYVTADGSGEGPFFASQGYWGSIELEATYNVRAYVRPISTNDIIYGNNITITTPKTYALSISPVKDIESKIATFKGSIVSNDVTFHGTIAHKGFCISTSSTPDLNNSIVWESPNTNLGDFEFSVDNLTKNTNYYVRAFGYNDTSNVYYSNVTSFKTVGYIGASGGYVMYDKGSYSNGWRYLEAAPNDATYNNSNLIKWGCTNTSIMQTSTDAGTGLENTNRIIQYCSEANCAAKVCYNYSVNGLSDWFLPSKGELYIMVSSLDGLVNFGDSINQTHWSSSEYDAGTAHLVNTYYNFGPAFGISKSQANLVRPIRRF